MLLSLLLGNVYDDDDDDDDDLKWNPVSEFIKLVL